MQEIKLKKNLILTENGRLKDIKKLSGIQNGSKYNKGSFHNKACLQPASKPVEQPLLGLKTAEENMKSLQMGSAWVTGWLNDCCMHCIPQSITQATSWTKGQVVA